MAVTVLYFRIWMLLIIDNYVMYVLCFIYTYLYCFCLLLTFLSFLCMLSVTISDEVIAAVGIQLCFVYLLVRVLNCKHELGC